MDFFLTVRLFFVAIGCYLFHPTNGQKSDNLKEIVNAKVNVTRPDIIYTYTVIYYRVITTID